MDHDISDYLESCWPRKEQVKSIIDYAKIVKRLKMEGDLQQASTMAARGAKDIVGHDRDFLEWLAQTDLLCQKDLYKTEGLLELMEGWEGKSTPQTSRAFLYALFSPTHFPLFQGPHPLIESCANWLQMPLCRHLSTSSNGTVQPKPAQSPTTMTHSLFANTLVYHNGRSCAFRRSTLWITSRRRRASSSLAMIGLRLLVLLQVHAG